MHRLVNNISLVSVKRDNLNGLRHNPLSWVYMSLLRQCQKLKLDYQTKFYAPPKENEAEVLKSKQECEESLYEFTKQAWEEIEGIPFIESWHIKALCDHLEEIYYNRINYLVANLPFRMGKSIVADVMFPAWAWAKNPSMKLLFISYSEELAKKHHIKNRDLLNTPWYLARWGTKFRIRKDVDNLTIFQNDQGGERMKATVNGQNTGFGSDIIIVDDPNKVMEADSNVIRGNTNLWWQRAMTSRWAAKAGNLRRVILQQRTHENDLSGFVKAQNLPNVVDLTLPYEFEKATRCETIVLPSTGGKKWRDPRTKENELMCPEIINKEQLAILKKELGSYAVASQLQQRPSPITGGYIKSEWFMKWCEEEAPKLDFVLQSWDTALTNTNSFSACTTWGVFKDAYKVPNIILLNMWVGKLEYPDLLVMIKRLSENYHDTNFDDDPLPPGPKPHQILIENKASGIPIIKHLRRRGVFVTPFNPTKYGDMEIRKEEGAKVARAILVSPLIESGRVWLPAKPPFFEQFRGFAEKFVDACVNFPSPSSNDIIDSMSQAFIKLQRSSYALHTDDPIIEESEEELDRKYI